MAFKPSYNPETGRFIILVRLSYFKGFEKTKSVRTGEGKLKYRTNGLFYKDTPEGRSTKKVLDRAVADIVEKMWPGKNPEKFIPTFDSKRLPYFDGDEYLTDDGEVREHYDGTYYIKLTNDKKPKYKKRDGSDLEDEDEGYELFVSGHWAVAYGHFFGIKDADKGGKGIFCTLDCLQFYKRDEQFQGGGIDDEEIQNFGDDDDDEDAEERPAKRSAAKKRSIDDDDDEEPVRKPAKRRTIDDDDDDEPVRKPAKRRVVDDDDDDEPPARKSAKRRVLDDDDV